jgi:hypothetical protein
VITTISLFYKKQANNTNPKLISDSQEIESGVVSLPEYTLKVSKMCEDIISCQDVTLQDIFTTDLRLRVIKDQLQHRKHLASNKPSDSYGDTYEIEEFVQIP